MLKIDLLPGHFRLARVNKFVAVVIIVILLVTLAGWGYAFLAVKTKIARTDADLTKVKVKADEVRGLEKETEQKQSDLQPIADKVDFAEAADKSGEQYWDRFHAINEYIYEKAQVTQFAVSPPTTVSFQVIVGDTTECARFVLDLIRCPALSQVSISGLPAGVSVAGVGGTGGTMSFSPQGPGMGMEEGMPAEEAEMMEGGGPGGGGPSGPTTTTAAQDIQLSVAAQLVEPVEEPMPKGAAGAAAGPGAGPGEFGPEMGPEEAMPPDEGPPEGEGETGPEAGGDEAPPP